MLTWWVVLAACAVGASACPQHCSCFTDANGYNSANCSTLALGGVQPSSLDFLNILPHQHGYPTKLAPRAFQSFRRVKFLWAVNCSILNLPNDVFQGLDYVIRMDLSYNKIRHLNGVVFKSLSSLHTLLLRGNPLFLNPWDVIVSDSLQELDLGHCGLRNIPQGTFISTPRLSRLSLDGNEIHTFTFNTIPAGLRYLNLAHNRISNVPTDVLTAMSYLRKLDLSKNPIKCNCYLLIMQDWFSGQGIIFENGVTCSEPSQYTGQQLSKINENELCTLEEKKRQRRINDIESYRDSKAHRTHNMIHDPDLQADQPDGELYSEVLFDDAGARGLGTHMELSNHHYPLPSDLSDENNKLATSKHDLAPSETHLALATKEVKHDGNARNGEIADLLHLNTTDISDEISTEDLSMVNSDSFTRTLTAEDQTRNTSDRSTDQLLPLNVTSEPTTPAKEILPTNSPENEMADEGYSPLYTSTSHSLLNHKENFDFHNESLLGLELADKAFDSSHNISGPEHEMADEGYSPVYNETDIMLEDEIGSGDDGIDTKNVSEAIISVHDGNTSTPATYTWPTSHSDTGDYNYEDTHHDYSVEVGPTTEAMTTTEVEEGSGDFADDTLYAISSSLPPYVNDDNETTTGGYHKVDLATDLFISSESTTEAYDSSSLAYSSSSESVTEEEEMVETTTEIFTEPPTTNLIDLTSETSIVIRSSEASPSTSESIVTTEATFSSSSSEPTVIMTSSSTESPSSSSPEWPIKLVDNEATTAKTLQETSATPEATHAAESTTIEPPISRDVEVISRLGKEDEKEQHIIDGPTQAESETGRTDPTQSTLTYIVAGLLVGLILLVLATVMCRKISKMGPCTSKTKVRLPHDTEANLGTEMQDMLLPKPPENGVKIIPQNGTQNGKEVKEEEIPVLQKDWDEKPEPIETVTARMSILEGPQTPVFIHKTLA